MRAHTHTHTEKYNYQCSCIHFSFTWTASSCISFRRCWKQTSLYIYTGRKKKKPENKIPICFDKKCTSVQTHIHRLLLSLSDTHAHPQAVLDRQFSCFFFQAQSFTIILSFHHKPSIQPLLINVITAGKHTPPVTSNTIQNTALLPISQPALNKRGSQEPQYLPVGSSQVTSTLWEASAPMLSVTGPGSGNRYTPNKHAQWQTEHL